MLAVMAIITGMEAAYTIGQDVFPQLAQVLSNAGISMPDLSADAASISAEIGTIRAALARHTPGNSGS